MMEAPLSRLFLLILFICVSVISPTYGQTCSTVNSVNRQCLGDAAQPISCPPFSQLSITSARIARGLSNVCPPFSTDDTCVEERITDAIRAQCQQNQQSECTPTWQAPTTRTCLNDGFRGGFFLEVVYLCEATQNVLNESSNARAIALCETDPVNREREGSNLHIDSQPIWFVDYVTDLGTCSCEIDVPANGELFILRLFFSRRSAANQRPVNNEPACAQRLEIFDSYGGVATYNICASGQSFYPIACQPEPYKLRTRFINDNPNVEVAFVTRFLTSNDVLMYMKCGLDFTNVEPTTVETTVEMTTMEMTTESQTTMEMTTTTPTTPSTTTATTTTPTTTTTTTPTTTTTTTTTPSTTTTTTTPSTTTTPTTTPTTTTTTPTTTTTATTTTTTTTESTTTAIPTTTTTVSTTTGEEMTTEEPVPSELTIWPIIVGILGAGILILLICCIVAGARYRSGREKQIFIDSSSNSDRGSGYTYITEVYVDGDQRSRLVVGRPAFQQNPVRPFPG